MSFECAPFQSPLPSVGSTMNNPALPPPSSSLLPPRRRRTPSSLLPPPSSSLLPPPPSSSSPSLPTLHSPLDGSEPLLGPSPPLLPSSPPPLLPSSPLFFLPIAASSNPLTAAAAPPTTSLLPPPSSLTYCLSIHPIPAILSSKPTSKLLLFSHSFISLTSEGAKHSRLLPFATSNRLIGFCSLCGG